MASMEEQETIITQNRADDYVSIYTSNTHDLRYFKSRKEFTLVQEWFNAETGEVEAASFTLPKERANIRKIVKSTRKLTDEQRQDLAESTQHRQKLELAPQAMALDEQTTFPGSPNLP